MTNGIQWAPPEWNEAASRRHRLNGPQSRKLWDRSVIRAQTAAKDEKSLYDPHLTADEIRDFEMGAIPAGAPHDNRPHPNELVTAIPTVRRFFRQLDRIVGASNGERTDYILVQYNCDGSVHGYPVTKAYLKSKGAAL